MSFYDLFYRSLYNSSYRIVEDSFEAEEVAQETILKALTRPEILKETEKEMGAILRRIAINHSIDLYRKRKKWDFVELNRKHEYSLEPEHEIDIPEKFSFALVREKMNELSESYKIILMLRLIEGLEYKEIAKELALDEAVTRVFYSRARKKLSELLRKEMAL